MNSIFRALILVSALLSSVAFANEVYDLAALNTEIKAGGDIRIIVRRYESYMNSQTVIRATLKKPMMVAEYLEAWDRNPCSGYSSDCQITSQHTVSKGPYYSGAYATTISQSELKCVTQFKPSQFWKALRIPNLYINLLVLNHRDSGKPDSEREFKVFAGWEKNVAILEVPLVLKRDGTCEQPSTAQLRSALEGVGVVLPADFEQTLQGETQQSAKKAANEVLGRSH